MGCDFIFVVTSDRLDRIWCYGLFQIDDMVKTRALSLDALRGYAIITMVLSGQIILTHLPAWMAHAQVPPNMGFTPTIAGITWVDLVFPFFLFAMGAAFPFSIGNKLDKGVSKMKICFDAFIRGLQLVFFAIFFQHMLPWVISKPVSAFSCLIALLAFALMFVMFMHIEVPKLKGTKYAAWGSWGVKILGYVVAFILMKSLNYEARPNGVFDPYFSNIILIVLANAAFFGTVIYVFTKNNPIYRLAVLPFVMAVFLASNSDGWVKEFYDFTPVAWAYKFYYLKYLFIVIPGSIAGEYLYSWIKNKPQGEVYSNKDNTQSYLMILLSLALIVSNVIFLFTRQLELNLVISILLLIAIYFTLRLSENSYTRLWNKLFIAGAYCLLLGLTFEAYEGGIKKDPSTYSYYFVTAGLAFIALIFFSAICDYFACVKSTKFLVMSGQNPMIAYVATSLVVMPILTLIHATNLLKVFETTAFLGFLRGIILTALAVLITMFFTKIKWFWRT